MTPTASAYINALCGWIVVGISVCIFGAWLAILCDLSSRGS